MLLLQVSVEVLALVVPLGAVGTRVILLSLRRPCPLRGNTSWGLILASSALICSFFHFLYRLQSIVIKWPLFFGHNCPGTLFIHGISREHTF